jgi:hypothetical protein
MSVDAGEHGAVVVAAEEGCAGVRSAAAVQIASSPSSDVLQSGSVLGHDCLRFVLERRPDVGLFVNVPDPLVPAMHRVDKTAHSSSRSRRRDHREVSLYRPWWWMNKAVSTSTGLGLDEVRGRNNEAWRQ